MQNLKDLSTETITTPPKVQKLDRKETLEKEHKDALDRAVSLNIPHAVASAEEETWGNTENGSPDDTGNSSKTEHMDARTNWNNLVKKLFKKTESGNLILKQGASDPVVENAPDS